MNADEVQMMFITVCSDEHFSVMLGLYVNYMCTLIHLQIKIVILKQVVSCLYKKECYIIKQLLTIESLNM